MATSILSQAQKVHRQLAEIEGLYARSLEQTQYPKYESVIQETYTRLKQLLEQTAECLDRQLQGLSVSVESAEPVEPVSSVAVLFELFRILSAVDSHSHCMMDMEAKLHVAVLLGQVPMAMFLLLPIEGHPCPEPTSIMSACCNGRIEIVRLLLADGRANPLGRLSITGDSPLESVCNHGPTEIARMLLGDTRVDPTVDNNRAIRIASKKGRTEIVQLL